MVAASIHFPMSNRLTKEEPGVGVTTHVWDPSDRLTNVQTPSGDRFTFTYNADGQRVEPSPVAFEERYHNTTMTQAA